MNEKNQKKINGLIEKVKPFVEMQNAFECEVSDYTTNNYNFGSLCATNDYLMSLVHNAFKGLKENQIDTISYLLDCARNYEFFVEKKEKGEWDNLIAECGENEQKKHLMFINK